MAFCLRQAARLGLGLDVRLLLAPRYQKPRVTASRHSVRTFAKKVNTQDLVPGSKQPITDPIAREEYAKAEEKMKGVVDWYRKECAAIDTRASGRVVPTMLSPVRVTLPGDTHEYRLEELATVGVKDGSLLLVTLFDESVRCLKEFSWS